MSSRSAAVQQAIRALRRGELPEAYADAWSESEAAGEDELWDHTAADGL